MTQVFEDIIVDAEFAALIPPLSAEERQQLEENIVEHGGARDPLVVWASKGTLTLLDGHNRYEICSRLGLPFDVHELRFKSRDEAEDSDTDAEPAAGDEPSAPKRKPGRPAARRPGQVAAVEAQLRRALGVKVVVHANSRGAGRIVIPFASLDEFQRLLNHVCE